MTSIANYVCSKSLDNSSDGEDFQPNAAQPNDSTRPSLEYGPSNFNIPHRFTWNFSYDFPNRGGSMQKLKNGWGLNSVVTLQSGQPFHLNYNFWDDYSGSGNAFDRPDVVGPIIYQQARSVQLSWISAPLRFLARVNERRNEAWRPIASSARGTSATCAATR